jgi:hypothetical protein
MWRADLTAVDGGRGLLVAFDVNSKRASFRRVFDAWQNDVAFREVFTQVLAGVPLAGFRWECPPITKATIDREFECVLLRADGLDRQPDEAAFAEFFAMASKASVVGFLSLGRDAYLIAPCPHADASVYPHLASFLRGAPREQVHDLWKRVGQEVAARLSDQPLWLSTAGMGVAWLHVRLDSRPKYYGHRPYVVEP